MDKIIFFQNLGFSEYEAKTLASLLKLKSASPKEISFDSSLPQNKLYSILKKFEKKGILAALPSDTKRYQLINIKTFINNRIKEQELNLKEIKKSFSKINKSEIKEEQFIFSLIKGQKAIMNKLSEHNSKVKKEILSVQRNWKVWGRGLREMQKAVRKGVKANLIGVINSETIKRASEWKKTGCKIKKYNYKFGENPLRFSIFDNKEARITIGKPEIKNPEDYITIWITSKPLISILRKQFLEMWKESEKF